MANLTKSEAQSLMARGLLVAHESDLSVGFKFSRGGNIESHDGGVFSSAEFWYGRRAVCFDCGWHLFDSQ